MQRRSFVVVAAASAGLWPAARAHHGWSSFDQERPVYLEGVVRQVAWRNPHAEFDLELAPGLALPADLAKRPVPAQSAQVDGAKLLANAVLPTRKDKVWHIELAPVSRINAWQLPELKAGDRVAMVGFTFAGEKGEAVLRVEYLFVGGKTYGMRSSPT